MRAALGKASVAVAWEVLWRFLGVVGILDSRELGARLGVAAPATQRIIRVTDVIVAKCPDFVFTQGLHGLSVLKKGERIATDAGVPVCAPYDGCLLIMPTMRHVKPGLTAVRLPGPSCVAD
jgi:hypothetical protein